MVEKKLESREKERGAEDGANDARQHPRLDRRILCVEGAVRHLGRKQKRSRSALGPEHPSKAGLALGPTLENRWGASPTGAGLVWFVNQHMGPKQTREVVEGKSGAPSEVVSFLSQLHCSPGLVLAFFS